MVTFLIWLPALLVVIVFLSSISSVVVVVSDSVLILSIELLLLLMIETVGRLVVALHVELNLALSRFSALTVMECRLIRCAVHRDVLHHCSQVVYLLLQAFDARRNIFDKMLVRLG